MRRKSVIGTAGVGLALCVLAAGFVAFASERAAFGALQSDADTAFARLRQNDGDLPVAVSLRNRSNTVEMCTEALIAPLADLFPAPDKEAVASRCETHIRTILEDAPAWGFGWFALGRAYEAQGDVERAAEALERAADLAPFEGWVIQKRVLLARDILSAEGGPSSAVLDATRKRLHDDLALLFSNRAYLDWLAELYAVAPDIHDDITMVAEAQPANIASGFLRAVRARLGLEGA